MTCGSGQGLLRTVSLSAADRRSRQLPAALAGPEPAPRGFPPVLAGQAIHGRAHDPRRRLRNIAGGEARRALPAARVIGIDFSATSVRHTEDLRRKYDLTNLEVHQLPIDRVGDLEMTFDEIVCTGVLHHLANPEAALRASARRARPGRRDASHGVCPVRTGGHLHAAGVLPRHRHPGLRQRDPRSRRRARRIAGRTSAVTAAARGTRLPAEAALADALLHPQDRAYSVPQLLDFIGGAGLTFSRWIRQAPYSPHCGLMARLPQAATIAALEPASSMPLQNSFAAP